MDQTLAAEDQNESTIICHVMRKLAQIFIDISERKNYIG